MDDPNQPPWPPPRDPWTTFNPRNPWQEARRRVAGAYGPEPDQRVGDAERSEMADVLGKHYADGRLDESEFRERLDRAMSAKTRRDLSGLLADLPPLGQPQIVPPPQPPRRLHRRMHPLLIVLVAFMLFTSLGAALWPYHVPWLLFAIVGFVLMRRHRWHSHNRYGGWYHRHDRPAGWDSPPPPPGYYSRGPGGTPPWV